MKKRNFGGDFGTCPGLDASTYGCAFVQPWDELVVLHVLVEQ